MTRVPFYKKIGFTLAFISICGILVMGITSIMYMSNSSEKVLDEVTLAQSEKALDTMDAILNNYRAQSKIAAVNLSENKDIITAFEKGNNDILRQIAHQTVHLLGLDINFITILDNQGNVIIRTHSDKTGDSLAYQENIRWALSGAISTYIEPGNEIKLSVRTGAPVKNARDEVIGVISTGFSLTDPIFVDRMKDITGNEFTLFIGDERVNTTVLQNGHRAINTKMETKIADEVLQGMKTYIDKTDVFGIPHVVAYKPIFTSGKEVIGAFATGISMEYVNMLRHEAMRNAVIIELLIMTIITFVLLLCVQKIIVNPLSDMAKTAGQIASGDFKVELQHKSKNELGILSDAIQVMADKLNNYIENLRRREDDLMIALHQAEQAEQAKSQFLANMSHEIRTPMNAIIGMSYLTLRTELTARQKDYINKIHQSSTSLLKILNDIMDFSKIESGKMHIENIKFELKNIVENSIQYISIQAQEKGLEFVCRISPKAPSHIKGDPLRLSEIISNLADNAVKFTEKGQVVIDVSPVGRVDNRVKLQFSISDTGIGMNKEQQKNLFVSFMQADSSTTRKYGGTGLGLPICKNLAELMGGKLEFTSEPDKGSNFIFTAWFEIAKGKSEIPKIMPHMIEGKKIMIVDDNCAARFTFREYLISMKFQTLAISSGEEAILETKKADTEDPFDVVFVDWEMNSGIDGIETAIEIKNSVEHVPKIVLLTISPDEDIYHEYSYCIDDVLVKPVSQSMIYDCLVNLFSPEYKETTNKHIFSEEDYGLSGFKVLLVEDNDINLQIATELLESQDIDVSVAKNGKEAIKLFSDMPSNSYDLILMDLQMPVMDGFEATRQIRGKDKNIPILAMSARTMVEEKQKCFESGMNDHIAKPINVNIFFETLVKWLDIDRKIKQTDDVVDIKIEGINTREGLCRAAGNKELYMDLLLRFTKHQEELMGELSKSILKGDFSKVKNITHTLKGLIGNIGANMTMPLVTQLEEWARVGKDGKYLPPIYHELKTNLERLAANIQDSPFHMRPANNNSTIGSAETISKINSLIYLLRESDMEALEYFDFIRDELKKRMDVEIFKELNYRIRNLEFLEAANILEHESVEK